MTIRYIRVDSYVPLPAIFLEEQEIGTFMSSLIKTFNGDVYHVPSNIVTTITKEEYDDMADQRLMARM